MGKAMMSVVIFIDNASLSTMALHAKMFNKTQTDIESEPTIWVSDGSGRGSSQQYGSTIRVKDAAPKRNLFERAIAFCTGGQTHVVDNEVDFDVDAVELATDESLSASQLIDSLEPKFTQTSDDEVGANFLTESAKDKVKQHAMDEVMNYAMKLVKKKVLESAKDKNQERKVGPTFLKSAKDKDGKTYGAKPVTQESNLLQTQDRKSILSKVEAHFDTKGPQRIQKVEPIMPK